MKMVVSYLNFVFFIKVKAKSKYKTLNFVFQFTKKTKWRFGCTDSRYFHSSINHLEHVFSQSTYHWLLLSCEYCKVFKNGLCYRTPQEAVVCRYSSKKVFLKVSQTSQESTCGGVFFKKTCRLKTCIFKNTFLRTIFKNTFSYRTPPVAASVFFLKKVLFNSYFATFL